MDTINIWAVLVATLISFVLGGIWFSPIGYGKVWMREVGLSEAQLASDNMGKIFGLSFVFILIIAFCLAAFIGDPSFGASESAFYGFLAGFGWIFFAFGVNGLFERKSWRYTFVSGGYWVVSLTLMGFIIGLMR